MMRTVAPSRLMITGLLALAAAVGCTLGSQPDLPFAGGTDNSADPDGPGLGVGESDGKGGAGPCSADGGASGADAGGEAGADGRCP